MATTLRFDKEADYVREETRISALKSSDRKGR